MFFCFFSAVAAPLSVNAHHYQFSHCTGELKHGIIYFEQLQACKVNNSGPKLKPEVDNSVLTSDTQTVLLGNSDFVEVPEPQDKCKDDLDLSDRPHLVVKDSITLYLQSVKSLIPHKLHPWSESTHYQIELHMHLAKSDVHTAFMHRKRCPK